ncbi:MAG: hypothetical protein NTZ56_12600 [Acidobacteria bacterium]|nr:hypothetical protein [Acidobacteriota bacterium]
MSVIEEAVVAKLRGLPVEQQQAVLEFVTSLETPAPEQQTHKGLRGVWKDIGFTISAEGVAEGRKEPRGNESWPHETPDRASTERKPRKSLYGLWKGSGVSISEEDIAAARKEMWGNFPREEFFK